MEQSTLMIVSALIAGIVCLGLGILLGIVLRRRIAEAKIGSAEEEAKRIVEAAKKQGEQKKKESLIEAKEEILRAKNESERELRERRNELNKQERRLVQKEESLDKKHETIDRKDEALNKKMKENADAAAEQRDGHERALGDAALVVNGKFLVGIHNRGARRIH